VLIYNSNCQWSRCQAFPFLRSIKNGAGDRTSFYPGYGGKVFLGDKMVAALIRPSLLKLMMISASYIMYIGMYLCRYVCSTLILSTLTYSVHATRLIQRQLFILREFT
jgi:hypothetical protein